MSLSRDVAALEEAHADGKLVGRDLEVIAKQVARAEAKILNAARSSALFGRGTVAALLSTET